MLGLLWAVVWLCWVADSPAVQQQRGSCSAAECALIERALSVEAGAAGAMAGPEDVTESRPERPGSSSRSEATGGRLERPGLRFFCRALVAPSVVAICAASWSVNIAFYVLQNGIPAYTRE